MTDSAVPLTIPAYLQSATDAGGPDHAQWLAELPAHVDRLAHRWNLTLQEPFEPGGSCSWVAPGTDQKGRQRVVKVTRVHTEARHEVDGLAALAGQGAVEIYDVEHLTGSNGGADTTAMLLERCLPGAELRTRPEREQHTVITTLLKQVWDINLPADHPFRPLTDMVDEWADQAEADLATHPDRLDPGLAHEGLQLFRRLVRDAPDSRLLCTDLHAGNVLSSQREPWLLIDPKPYVGDPHYDVIQHLLNCERSINTDPIGLIRQVAAMTDLDADRVRHWLFARCVQESTGDVPPWRTYTAILRKLGTP